METKEPKAEKKGKSENKGKKSYPVWKLYEVKGEQLIRKNPFSPKAGPGFFMARHKNRLTCGKTHYMETVKS